MLVSENADLPPRGGESKQLIRGLVYPYMRNSLNSELSFLTVSVREVGVPPLTEKLPLLSEHLGPEPLQ